MIWPMKRWWIVLAAVGMFGLLVALLTPRDDGLNWIRTFGGTETHLGPRRFGEQTWIDYEFNYVQVPNGLEQALNQRIGNTIETQIPGLLDAELDGGLYVVFSASDRKLSVSRLVEPPWLVRQWLAFKRSIGI
jgi:hypothetical protein